jgi:hypothetical protein
MTGGTGNLPSVNQSVRLTQQVAPETFEWRCEKNHLRTPDNTTHNGFCKTCAMVTLRPRPSRWIKHTIVAKQEPKTALEQAVDLHFAHYEAEQKRRADTEQQREQQRRDRESQERQTRDAQSAAFSLMDADKTEIEIVTKRLAGRNCPASVYVAEIRKLREI